MEDAIFDFEYEGTKYYYIRCAKADRILVDKDKHGKTRFKGAYRCVRCGGEGEGNWQRDNGICYECWGTGYSKVILETTKNLETAQRRLKVKQDKAKEIQDRIEKQMKERKEHQLEYNLERIVKQYTETFYLILDTLDKSTYYEREYIKSKGGHFNYSFCSWWIPKYDNIQNDFKDFYIQEIQTRKVLDEYNELDVEPLYKIVTNYKKELDNKREVK